MNFLQRTPFLRLLLALIAGIILYPTLALKNYQLIIIALTALALLGSEIFLDKPELQYKFRWLFGMGVLLTVFVIGYLLCMFNDYNSRFDNLNKTGTFVATVSSPTVEKPKSYRCEIKLQKFLNKNSLTNTNGKAIVYFEKSAQVKNLLIGDQILLHTKFKNPPGAENPDAFNYAKYLNLNGIRATAYIDSTSWCHTSYKTPFSILRTANQLRTYLLHIYTQYGIKDLEFAVLAALTVGYTDDLSPDIRSSYSASGAMHILSVSGLHVGIVYAVIAFFLSFMRQNNFQIILKAILIVLFLWSYAFVTGLSPSVIRSALMFSFVAVGTALNRKSYIYNTIFMSAFFILVCNPNLIYNIGFQLSYSAVLGIIIFHPPLTKLFPTQNKFIKPIRDLVLVSLAAQIGTLAFTLYYFQQFPNYFILTNLVAIPLSTGIIYGAIALLATASIPIVANIVAAVLNQLLIFLNYAIVQIHHLPHSTSIIALSFLQMVFLMMFITCISWYFYSKKASLIHLSLLSIIAILAISTTTIFNTKHRKQLIVYSSAKQTHINFIEYGKNYLYSTLPSEAKYIAENFWRKNHIDTVQNVNTQKWFATNYAYFSEKKIIIADKKHWTHKSTIGPLNTDILIIGNKLKPKMEKLLENINPKLIVVDKTISNWYTENIRSVCIKNSIEFYSIAQDGAYILTSNQ